MYFGIVRIETHRIQIQVQSESTKHAHMLIDAGVCLTDI